MLILAMITVSCTPRQTVLTFLESTDTHGSYVEFAKDASLIRQMRDSLGDHLILMDNGDNMQGTPYQYCSNHDLDHQTLVSSFFNFFPYDVVNLGNHDIEAGRQVFDRVASELKMPYVCANIIDDSTGNPYFQPYQILERDGFKIAVLGLLTPYVVTWVPERLRPGLSFESVEGSAARWVSYIQEKEHPDLMVGLLHSGWEPQEQNLPEDAPLGRENATRWVAENIPGFDIIFYGHDHRGRADKVVNIEGDTVYVVDSGSRGSALAQAEVMLTKGEKPVIRIGLIPAEGQEPDAEFLMMLQPYLDRAQAYQEEEVAVLPVDINPEVSFYGSALWVDEVHRFQFDEMERQGVPCDISLAAPLSNHFGLSAGMLTVADFFVWYPYENSLAVVSMTGKDVKAHLEYSYGVRRTVYNFDSAAGIIYTVDPKKPDGERVTIVSMSDGTPFDEDKEYKVVMNSYRSMGGGNHFVNGCGWRQEDIKNHHIWNSDRDLRSLFIDWARSKGTLDAEPLGNWSVI